MFLVLYLSVVSDEELKDKEPFKGLNGSGGVSMSANVVAPATTPSTISYAPAMEIENLTTVNGNIQGRI